MSSKAQVAPKAQTSKSDIAAALPTIEKATTAQIAAADKANTEAIAKSEAPAPTGQQPRNLYVTVNTYGSDGKQVGTRVVDMYHYGTRNWLQGHMWWAVHHGHTTETMIANDAEVADYVKAQEVALAHKYAKDNAAA